MRKRPVVAELEKHHSRIRGDLQAIHEELIAAGVAGPELAARRAPEIDHYRNLLASIETCLALVEPSWTPDHLQPRRTRRAPEMAWSELLHIAYRVLQPADQPLTSSEVLERLWLEGKLTREQAQSVRYRSALTKLLREEEKRAAVLSIGIRPARWKVRERGDPRTASPRRIGTRSK